MPSIETFTPETVCLQTSLSLSLTHTRVAHTLLLSRSSCQRLTEGEDECERKDGVIGLEVSSSRDSHAKHTHFHTIRAGQVDVTEEQKPKWVSCSFSAILF